MPEFSEAYTSVRATPELVGREKERQQIGQAIGDTERSYVIYITGAGGIGKTSLVKHVLKHPPQKMTLMVADDLIDLYHTQVHSLAGLIDAILKVKPPLADLFKQEIEEREANEWEALARAEQEGLSLAEVISHREKMTQLFLEILNEFTQEHRLVLAFDTAERLMIEQDPAQQHLELTEEHPAVLDWLLYKFLPHIENTVVLLAGRPHPGDLNAALEQALSESPVRLLPIEISGLDETESLEYFEAVIRHAESLGLADTPDIALIRALSEDERQVIFHCLRDESEPPTVRPILLALAIDHLAVAGHPIEKFWMPLADARDLSPEQREEIRRKLERELVRAIREDRRPADELIDTLGWLRKGADTALLARVTGWDEAEVKDVLQTIHDLSFIKVRPADDRLFLHDEMYDIIQRHTLLGGPAQARVFQATGEYYKARIEQARKDIARLYQGPTESEVLPDPSRVIELRAGLRDALVEDLHYRLRGDAAEGFQIYFKYAEEAIAAADESLDMQLRAELLGFLAEHDPSGTAEEIDGLRRADVVADAAVRWIKRLIYDERHEQALETATRLRTEAKDLIEAGGDLAQAELGAWEALADLYTGSHDEARQLLDRALGLEKTDIPPKQDVRWSAVLARAYNNLGYLRRVRGQFENAVAAYKEALPLWEYAKMEADRANTLNNLAFALALSGHFDDAVEQAQKALDLREQLGPRAPVALTYNTLAEIETRAGDYQKAEEYTEQASSISQSLGFKRGKGLALITKSILHRYMSEDSEISAAEKLAFLNKAVSESAAALRIFTQEITEPEREIRACIERGLSSRELSRVSEPGAEKEEYFRNAITDLDRAKNRAGETGLAVLYLDALLGLAWTYYYAGEEGQLEHAMRDLEDYIQEHFSDYRIAADKLPDIKKDTLADAFAQFGRLYVLRGSRAMDAFERSDKQPPYPDLQKAAREFAIALEYDMLIAREYVGIQRATSTTITKRFDGLSKPELKVFYDAVAETARKLGREKCRLWEELEKHSGIPYKVLKRLVK